MGTHRGRLLCAACGPDASETLIEPHRGKGCFVHRPSLPPSSSSGPICEFCKLVTAMEPHFWNNLKLVWHPLFRFSSFSFIEWIGMGQVLGIRRYGSRLRKPNSSRGSLGTDTSVLKLGSIQPCSWDGHHALTKGRGNGEAHDTTGNAVMYCSVHHGPGFSKAADVQRA